MLECEQVVRNFADDSIYGSRALSTKQRRLFSLTFRLDPRWPAIRASSGEKVKRPGISSSASKDGTIHGRIVANI